MLVLHRTDSIMPNPPKNHSGHNPLLPEGFEFQIMSWRKRSSIIESINNEIKEKVNLIF